MRTKEEIKNKQRQDPFYALRNIVPKLTDDELYYLYQTVGLSEWEKNNIEEYIAEKILLED